MFLILKTIKLFKKYYQSIVVMWQHMFSMPVTHTVWRRALNWTEVQFDKEINKELPEDDLIEDRNMLEYFIKCFKLF
jgi:hypothetical protein